ncbi:Serine/threonine protein kinase [Minicystis rosea]|nr:Serine/threonine protein kinase [Minicystis rosea]
MIGAIIGQRYRIVRLVGAGGMGSVYEAVHVASTVHMAMKLITAETARNATLVGRFEREARATTTLDTPHIVKVLDTGTDTTTGLPFLVMELLDGEDVSHLVKRLGPLSPSLALRIVAQACLGLQKAHEARIIHRDIKPANLYLARDGGTARTVKLLDFGVAKITRDPDDTETETAGLTSTGSMLGSPLYMSPEQARGLKEIDRRSDIWSLGVVLYQALTGRTPHQGSDALGELIISICTEEPTPIQELAPWVPARVAAVAHAAMRFDPAHRFQSAAEMLRAIEPLLPDGWAIDDSMLRPLDEAERSRIEARASLIPEAPPAAPPPAAPLPRVAPIVDVARAVERAPVEIPAPRASIDGLGRTLGAGATKTSGGGGPNRSSRGVMIGGGIITLAAGTVLAVKALAPGGASAPVGNAGAAIVATATVAAEPAPRTVRLVVLPEGASVMVDGARVQTKDGVVELRGALGSVHEVRVSAGDDEDTQRVVIAESGPVPAKVQLDVKTPKSAAPAVRPLAPKPKATAELRNER